MRVARNPANRLGEDPVRSDLGRAVEERRQSGVDANSEWPDHQWRREFDSARLQPHDGAIWRDGIRDGIVSNQRVSAEQAFQAMSRFLVQYYERAGRKSELAAVLSDIQTMPDGRPADPAAWEGWLEAVRAVLDDTRN
ncbi:MAG TPA: hypothetical protein VGM07_05755 [Stellaceae bacterium]